VERWQQVAALSLGGVLGVNARYWLGTLITRWAGSQFPWATFSINVSGSFLIGLVSVFLARWLPHPLARLFIVVGFLGGYTTFSSFSFESLVLWERGERWLCLGYIAGSVLAGFAAVVLGGALGGELTRPNAERPSPARATSGLEPRQVVTIPADARLLSIHLSGNERYDGKPVVELIVEIARSMNLAGASVFPVEMSYGGHREVHDALSDYTFFDVPLVVEIVEGPARVTDLLSALEPMLGPALVTVENVKVVRYAHLERS
jgi:CrcB protein